MRRIAVLAGLLLAPGCRISLEDSPAPVDGAVDGAVDAFVSPACLEAPNHSDLAWIEENVFRGGCALSNSCHNGANTNAANMLDLRVGNSHAELVGVQSKLAAQYQLVVPGQPQQSYLLMLIQQIAPQDMDPPASPPPNEPGFMPQNSSPLCEQKRAAVQRWIEAGALDN